MYLHGRRHLLDLLQACLEFGDVLGVGALGGRGQHDAARRALGGASRAQVLSMRTV